MKYLKSIFLILFALLSFHQGKAQCSDGSDDCSHSCCNTEEWNVLRPDGIAPIGIMGDHYHHRKGWMLSYNFMQMNMRNNYQGTDKISTATVHESYMVSPTDMQMRMHMVGIMYAFTDNFTVMGMLPMVENEMSMVNRTGMAFSTRASGVGDAKLSFILGLKRFNKQSLHLNAGLILPTGSITERDNTPMQEQAKLPYPMQLGSGTWGSTFGLTYTGQASNISWGAQPMVYLRHGENPEGYTLGNQYRLNGWVAYRLNNWLSCSFRSEGVAVESTSGQDDELNPMMAPTADITNTGSTGLNSSLGLNVYIPKGKLQGLRLGFEYTRPLYYDVDGIQMRPDDILTMGAKIDF